MEQNNLIGKRRTSRKYDPGLADKVNEDVELVENTGIKGGWPEAFLKVMEHFG